MTTTNLVGKIVTNDGQIHMIQQEPTDGTPENLTIYGVDAVASEIYDSLAGKVIRLMQIQASDGSYFNIEVKQNGQLTHDFDCPERTGNQNLNLNEMVNIPVTPNTRIQVDTTD